MNNFTYEEQNENKYLVYEKKADDVIDTMALGMISNNKIKGIVPFTYTQIDGSLYMEYNISGLISFQESFGGVVNRKKLLDILYSLADVFIRAEEYMLESSSFVLDVSYIYVEPKTKQVELIVLPVEREEIALASFLRQLIFSSQYDQNENGNYIAALISFFNSNQAFSISEFKSLIQRLQEESDVLQPQRNMKQATKETKRGITLQKNSTDQQNLAQWKDTYTTSQQASQGLQPLQQTGNSQIQHSMGGRQLQNTEQSSFQQVQQGNGTGEELPEEKPKEKKKGLFGKKEKKPKQEKPQKEKKGLFGRKSEKKKKESGKDSRLENLAIPGMDQGSGDTGGGNQNNSGQQDGYVRKEHMIPEQQVYMKQYQVQQQEFGATVDLQTYMSSDDTTVLEQNQNMQQLRPNLYRIKTGEIYWITKAVTRIGRNQQTVDICIVGNSAIGREHALIYMQDGRITLEDHQSKNGTFVDGVRVQAGGIPVPLNHGTRICLGDEEFEFRMYE